jgi:hypothetical protein
MSLRFGDILQPTDPLIVTYTLFREALLATSAIWQPLWAYVSAFMMDYWKGPIVPGAPVIRYNPFLLHGSLIYRQGSRAASSLNLICAPRARQTAAC